MSNSRAFVSQKTCFLIYATETVYNPSLGIVKISFLMFYDFAKHAHDLCRKVQNL